MLSKKFFRPLWVALFGALLVFPAFAGDPHFIVRASGSTLQRLVSKGAIVVRSFSGSGAGLHVVSVHGLSKTDALRVLLSENGVTAESDTPVTLPEASPASALRAANPLTPSNLDNQLLALVRAIQSSSCTSRASAVWAGYFCQPASGVINLTAAHKFATGAGIVGVLDTGIDPTHPALAGSVMPGWDFVANVSGGYATPNDAQSTTSILDQSTTSILDDTSTGVVNQSTTSILDDYQSTTSILDQSTTSILDNKPASYYGHGTMVAGLIHLVAPTARLMPIRIFANDGTAGVSQIIQGLYFAVDHGVKVVNMSFSMTGYSQELANAMNYATAKGLILVAAAGNEGQNIMVYPAGLNTVLGIGSTNDQDARSNFSNFGRVVTLAAPGEAVVTTYPAGRYALGWGTSFSAPLVAGGIALLNQMDVNLTWSRASNAITQSAPVGQDLGAGRLDLFRACSYEASGGNR